MTERAEHASLLGSRSSSSSSSSSGRRARAARVVGGAACVAAAASVGLWTHKTSTLQEAWRPVPGSEGDGGARGSGIARWRASSSSASANAAALGQAGATLSGVTATPAQMGALRALRLQIRTAMFNPATNEDTLRALTAQLTQIVPDARDLFPPSGPASVNDLEGAVKALMARSAVAAPAASSLESEFRVQEAPAIEVPIADDDASLSSSSSIVAPARTYETALRETRHATRDFDASARARATPTTNEQSTMAQNDDLQAMIYSLDRAANGAVASERPTYAYERDEDAYDGDANDARGDEDEYEAPRRGEPELEPEPERARAFGVLDVDAFLNNAEPETRRTEDDDRGAAASTTFMEAIARRAEPTPSTDVEPRAEEPRAEDDALDDSWVTSFTNDADADADASWSVDALLNIPGAAAQLAQAPEPEPEPERAQPQPVPDVVEPQPEPVVAAAAAAAAAQETTPAQAVPAQPHPDDALVNAISEALRALRGNASASTSGESGVDDIKFTTPREPNADANAIAANVLALIQKRIQSNAAASTASMGLSDGRVPPPLRGVDVSKEDIAASIARSLTAATTPAVQANAIEQTRTADSTDPVVDPHTRMIADAMVAHDERVAHRVAEILTRGDGEATLGTSTPESAQNAREEAAQLIVYEEQRRAREEVQAMRRDLAALMANVQAHYAMGLTEHRIDATASSAASQIVETLKPVLGERDGGTKSSSSSSTRGAAPVVFEYPTMASSTPSKTNLVLRGVASRVAQRAAEAADHEAADAERRAAIDAGALSQVKTIDESSIHAPWEDDDDDDAASRLGTEPKRLKDAVEAARLEADFLDADVMDTGRAIASRRSGAHDFALPDFNVQEEEEDDDDDGNDARATKKASTSRARRVADDAREIIRGVFGDKKSSKSRDAAADDDDDNDRAYDVDEHTARAVRENKHLIHHSRSKYS